MAIGGAAAQKQLDEEGRSILYDGASVGQLAKLFGLDNRTVAARIQGLPASGMRAGFPIYAIGEAATRLVRLPEEEIEARLRRMNPSDMPKMLSKEFWAGMTARRRYEHAAGDLWTTDEVKQAATTAFATLRTALLLLPEQAADQGALTDKQREVVQRLVDAAMEEVRARLTDKFTRAGPAPRDPESEDGGL